MSGMLSGNDAGTGSPMGAATTGATTLALAATAPVRITPLPPAAETIPMAATSARPMASAGAAIPDPPATPDVPTRGQSADSPTGTAAATAATRPTPVATPATTTSTSTVAPTTLPATFGEPTGAAGAVGGTVLALLLVVGVILALAWLAKRMPGIGSGGGNPSLKIVGSLALGPRERLVVVAVGDTQLMLSTGPHGTRALHTLEQPLPVATTSPSPFAQVLAQQFGRKKA